MQEFYNNITMDNVPEITLYYNRHYITTDAQGRITDGWSDGPQPDRDTTGAICINEEGGYQFRLWLGGEENPSLYTMDGIPLYRCDTEKILIYPRSEEEIAVDRAAIPAPPPSAQEQLRADVDFIAAMGGIQL